MASALQNRLALELLLGFTGIRRLNCSRVLMSSACSEDNIYNGKTSSGCVGAEGHFIPGWFEQLPISVTAASKVPDLPVALSLNA